jgi:hypothetical protein
MAAMLWLMKGALLALLGFAPVHATEPTVQPLPRLETGMHAAGIKRIAAHAAGRWAVAASADKTARVWDLVDPGKPAQVLRRPQDVFVFYLAGNGANFDRDYHFIPHDAFTFALLEGLRGKADRNGNGTVEVRELADHVEERLAQITRKWGYEPFPFSSTEGQSFTLVPKP